MAKKVIRSLNSDPRYMNLLKTFAHDWPLAMYMFFGKYPDAQQDEIIDSVYRENCRVSVKSGHGTGKSDLSSMIILLFMIFNPNARVVIIAAKISVVKDAIWSNMFTNFEQLQKRLPWVAHYFELTDTAFYERSKKLTWRVSCKGYRINNEQTLAGEHRDYMLTIIDEASVVTDAAFKTILGAQTSKDNRVALFSQPTQVGGFFYETHNSLKREEGGKWASITLRSDESEWVQPAFIENALSDYGGYDSPEFQIKVLGRFPQKMNEFLLGRAECQAAVDREIDLDDDWGWVACCDVGITRDRSVLNIGKMSGPIGPQRKYENHYLSEMASTVEPLTFAKIIVARCCSGSYPNITIAIDIDGIGYAVWQYVTEEIEKQGYDDVTVVGIRWGKPPFTKKQKDRFKNLRALAHVYAADAIKDGRLSIDSGIKTVDQFSKLPVIINPEGKWVMMPKEQMKKRYQLSSPDRSDTYCFAQIINYTPADQDQDYYDEDEAALNEFLESDKDAEEIETFDASRDGWEAAADARNGSVDYDDWDES